MIFPFPKDFLFGAASSAVQIEAACEEGCKGQIGAEVYLPPCHATDPNNAEDVAAAARYQDYQSGWWLDTMLKGHYPQSSMEIPYIREKCRKDIRSIWRRSLFLSTLLPSITTMAAM